jgi:bis(5'-nucleosyl)-tetraphosphatase (symmetrical)
MQFLVGDIQGCRDALDRLLAEIGFSPSRDRIHVLGDLVNRGPDSLGTLRRLRALGDAAACLIGNHDLHLLAVACGVRPAHRSDTLDAILADPERDAWIDWIRSRRLAAMAEGWLLVHAGVVPQWDAERTLALAREVETMLAGPDLRAFLQVMYGNEPSAWRDDLAGADRWRFVINTLTRIRFCDRTGKLDFKTKDGADAAPPGFMPWFEVPGRRSAATPIAFGHWSTLGLRSQPKLLALDTGCVWGGALSAARIDGGRREIVQVKCPQAQAPG